MIIKNFDYCLSINDTFLIKGIAICLMLWHHLFYLNPEYGTFVFQTGQLGNVCVTMFLFVSAYGLTIQYSKTDDKSISAIFQFQVKRFVKFYANYWVIFFIFIPLGVFLFGRNLQDAYGETNPIKSLIFDFLGINGYQSYNATWWFNRLIICLYLLFPLLYFSAKKWCILTLLFSMLLLQVHRIEIPVIHDWLFYFIIGIICAQKADRITTFLNKYNKYLILIVFVLLFCMLAYLRVSSILTHFRGIRLDGFLSICIIILSILVVRNIPYINTSLQYLGKHSMNIFMIHTFIYNYFFHDFIYSFHYPIFIFSALLISSLIVSILIEFLKKELHLSSVIKKH